MVQGAVLHYYAYFVVYVREGGGAEFVMVS